MVKKIKDSNIDISKISSNLIDINNYILSNLNEESSRMVYYETLKKLKNKLSVNTNEEQFKNLLKDNYKERKKKIIENILNNYFIEKNKNKIKNEKMNQFIKEINLEQEKEKEIEKKNDEMLYQNNLNINKENVFDNQIINFILERKGINKNILNLLKSGTFLFLKDILNDLILTSNIIKNEFENDEKKLISLVNKDKKNEPSNFELVTVYDPLSEFKINENIESKIAKFYENKLITTKENKEMIRSNMDPDKSKNHIINENKKKKKIHFDEDYEICKIINKLKLEKLKVANQKEVNKEDQNQYINYFMNNNQVLTKNEEINLDKRETNTIEENNILLSLKELIFYLSNSSKYNKSKYYFKALLRQNSL